MEYTFDWLKEGTIIEGQVTGYFDPARMCNDVLKKVKENGSRQAHLLLNISELELSPVNMSLLSSFILPLILDRAVTHIVLYGQDAPLMEIIGPTMTRSMSSHLRILNTREDALAYLESKGART